MMRDDQSKVGPDRFEVNATAGSHFAWLRTRMSIERTMMSWLRTAVSLIGFGFTIYQFLDRLNTDTSAAVPRHPQAPWYLGLTLIGTGTAALIVGTIEYRTMVMYLWSKNFAPIAGIDRVQWHTPVLAVALLLIITGLFAFGAVFLRIA